MVFTLLIVVFVVSIFLSYKLFGKLINPLSIYVFIWTVMLFLYYLKFINYINLSVKAWSVIIIAYVSFFLGIITYFTAFKVVNRERQSGINRKSESLRFFSDNGKMIRNISYFFAMIGLIGAVQNWMVLLKLYGSLTEVIVHLSAIYRARVSGQIVGVIPYLSSASYVAIFFAGIYSAWKKRFTLVAAVPLLVIIIQGVAQVGRAGILFGFVEFGLTYVFSSFYFDAEGKILKSRLRQIVSALVIVILFILSVVLVKNLRGETNSFVGQTRAISNTKNDLFITPALYLYLSGDVGVLSKYLDSNGENTKIGENTFQFVYNILSKFGVIEKPYTYQKGYYIPTWMNTGTYLRELIADFGVGGMLVFVYFLGLFSAYFWNGLFYEKRFGFLIPLVYITIIITISFLMMITRAAAWFISFIVILGLYYIIDKFTLYPSNSNS